MNNITGVMEDGGRTETVKRITECALTEFFEKGYEKASLRTICSRAGVTTGAFYFSFTGKEQLLRSIIDPLLLSFEKMIIDFTAEETAHPENGTELDRRIMDFLICHRRESLIVMEHSAGSCYADYHRHVEAMMTDSFRSYFADKLNAEPDPDLIAVLVRERIEGALAVLRGNYDREHSLSIAEKIGIHANAGAAALIASMLEETHH